MSINYCVITPNYPFERFPENGLFVEKLVKNWVLLERHVDVVAPISVPTIIRSLYNKEKPIKNAGCQVERPIYLTVSNKKLGPIQLHKISRYLIIKAVMKGVKNLKNTPDLFYGKFLLTGGIAAYEAGRKYNRPIYLDLGESRLIERMNRDELEISRKVIPHFDKIFCVSQRLVDEAIELGANPANVVLAPNTVNTDKFRPLDKNECREELGLPKDQFIVIFVGHYIERKGPLRVLNAINSLNSNVKGVFLGNGKQQPVGDNVLFADSVPNDELPTWLNAADIFVLPTLAEGYCNAINEAMACGLPIVTSDIEDVKNQVKYTESILVNPEKTDEIAEAILSFQKKRGQLKKIGEQNHIEIQSRHKKGRPALILEWIENKI